MKIFKYGYNNPHINASIRYWNIKWATVRFSFNKLVNFYRFLTCVFDVYTRHLQNSSV